MLQGSEDQVLCAHDVLRSSPVRYRLCSGCLLPHSKLLPASRDLLCRSDLVLLSSDELRWQHGGSGWSRSAGQGNSAAAEGRYRSASGFEGLIALGMRMSNDRADSS